MHPTTTRLAREIARRAGLHPPATLTDLLGLPLDDSLLDAARTATVAGEAGRRAAPLPTSLRAARQVREPVGDPVRDRLAASHMEVNATVVDVADNHWGSARLLLDLYDGAGDRHLLDVPAFDVRTSSPPADRLVDGTVDSGWRVAYRLRHGHDNDRWVRHLREWLEANGHTASVQPVEPTTAEPNRYDLAVAGRRAGQQLAGLCRQAWRDYVTSGRLAAS